MVLRSGKIKDDPIDISDYLSTYDFAIRGPVETSEGNISITRISARKDQSKEWLTLSV